MNVTLHIDSANLRQALRDYQAHTHKSAANVVNRQLKSIAITGQQMAADAKADQIRSLVSRDWWPKLIAKLLAKKMAAGLNPILQAAVAGVAFQAQWAREQNELSFAGPGLGRKMNKMESRYAMAANKLSKTLINKRVRSIQFVKFFFVLMARAISPYVRSSAKSPALAQRHSNYHFRTEVTPATPEKPEAVIQVSYLYSGNVSTERIDALLQKWLSRAAEMKAADIWRWIREDQIRAAQLFSGRPAA